MWDGITFGNVLTILVLGVTGLVAYFGWQRAVDAKFNVLSVSISEKFASQKESFDSKFTALAIQINTIMMRDVEGLQRRMAMMEADSTEMHKRYHQVSNDINGLGLKVDRLEHPRSS